MPLCVPHGVIAARATCTENKDATLWHPNHDTSDVHQLFAWSTGTGSHAKDLASIQNAAQTPTQPTFTHNIMLLGVVEPRYSADEKQQQELISGGGTDGAMSSFPPPTLLTASTRQSQTPSPKSSHFSLGTTSTSISSTSTYSRVAVAALALASCPGTLNQQRWCRVLGSSPPWHD